MLEGREPLQSTTGGNFSAARTPLISTAKESDTYRSRITLVSFPDAFLTESDCLLPRRGFD